MLKTSISLSKPCLTKLKILSTLMQPEAVCTLPNKSSPPPINLFMQPACSSMTPKYGKVTLKLTRRGNILSATSPSFIASFVGPKSRPQVPDTIPPMPYNRKIRSITLKISLLPLHRIVKPFPHSAPPISH